MGIMMNKHLSRWGWGVVCLGLAISTAVAAGLPPAQTSAAGVKYVIGGVGDDERKGMRTAYRHYKLRVEIAEKGGAYTTDMQLKLKDAQGQTLVDVLVDGPWLLVDVPSGSYVLEVSKDGSNYSQKITLGNEVQQHVVFIWPKTE